MMVEWTHDDVGVWRFSSVFFFFQSANVRFGPLIFTFFLDLSFSLLF